MEFKIKPCPVCGGKRIFEYGKSEGEKNIFRLMCKDCGYEGPVCGGEQVAKAAWNGVYDALNQQETPATRKTILSAAEKCVCQDRQDTHGRPEDSFSKIADLWTAYLGTGQEITPVDVANMMILLKIARAKGNPAHMDNWVDVAGYAACGGEIAAEIYGN